MDGIKVFRSPMIELQGILDDDILEVPHIRRVTTLTI